MSELVVVEPTIDMGKYARAMELGRRANEAFDRSALDAVDSINKLEKAANKIKSGEIDIKVDTSDIDRAVSDVKEIDGTTPKVTVQADTGALDHAVSLKDLIEGSSPKVTVQTDSSSLDHAEGKIKAIDGATPEVKVNANTEDVEHIEDELQNIQRAAHIELIINYAPGALDLLSKITGVGGQVENQVARSTFSVGTGGAEIDAATIDQIYSITGKTREEIAAAAASVFNLTGNMNTLGADTLSSFMVAKGGGEELTKVIQAQSQLVRNGLAPDFQTAGDLIAAGFNKNANRAGDFLDTIIEYSPNFKTMGITGEAAIGGIVSVLSQGTFNADKFGDTIKETGILLGDALSDPSGTKFKILSDLKLVDDAEAVLSGEKTFEQFLNGFKIAAAGLSEADRNLAITELFGTPAEDLGFDIFAGMDLTPIEDAAGTAQTLFDLSNDNLPSAFAELGRTFETEVLHKFIDLQGLLDEVTEKIHIITELLRGGTGLPEALEIALEAPGLAESINKFAGTANNLVLEFLLGVSNILQGLGNMEAATAIRDTVAGASAGQLTYDLKLSDTAQQALDAIQTAQRRGVDDSIIETATNQAAIELIDKGNLAEAQTLLDRLTDIPPASVDLEVTVPDDTLTGAHFETITIPLEIDKSATAEQIGAAIEQAKTDYIEQNPDQGFRPFQNPTVDFNKILDTTAAQTALLEARDKATELEAATTEAGESVGFVSDQMALMTTGTLPEWREEVGFTTDDFKTFDTESDRAINHVIDNADEAGESFTAMAQRTFQSTTYAGEGLMMLGETTEETGLSAAVFLETVNDALPKASAILQIESEKMVSYWNAVRDAANEAGAAGNNVIGVGGGGAEAEGRRAGGGGVLGGVPYLVGEGGRETYVPGAGGSILNNRTTEAMIYGLMLGMGGGGTTNNNTNINLNIIQNNQGAAAAAGGDTRLADRIRGF